MSPLGFVAHLITFNCYGIHLRGAADGSVDRTRERRGGSIEPSPKLVAFEKRGMTDAEASLDSGEARVVLSAILETCAFRNWTLLAAHVRRTHVHLVVDGIMEASNAIRDFKAYASRALNHAGVRRRWSRGANVRLLRDSNVVRAAVRYVVDGQGPPMAVYIAPDFFRGADTDRTAVPDTDPPATPVTDPPPRNTSPKLQLGVCSGHEITPG